MNLIDNENFCKFKPIFNSILRILLKDDIDFQIVQGVETEIYDDTKIPDHIYMGRTINEIWIACGVIFNSLESTVLKELLTFNKNDKILKLLLKGFSGNLVLLSLYVCMHVSCVCIHVSCHGSMCLVMHPCVLCMHPCVLCMHT